MKYELHVDVVFSGNFEVEAKTKKEAEEKIRNKYLVPNDIRNFYHIKTRIVK